MSKIRKQSLVFLITLSLVMSTFSLPVFTPKAQAFLGIGDVTFVIDTKAIIRAIMDGIAMKLAQKMTNDIVKSTVAWANTGFEGNPTYVTDLAGFAKRSADSAVGQFINDSKFKSLCTPFQGKIQLALRNSYYSPQDEQVQCSFTSIKGDLNSFYDDFSSGGWQGWISMTQNPNNNPYDVYMKSKIEMDSRLANTLGIQQKEIDINKGFLDTKDCIEKNPSDADIAEYNQDPVGSMETGNPIATGSVRWDPTKPGGACIKYGPTKTPGSQIASQLEKALPSGMQKLVTVNHFEQLIGAFAQGILNRYVLSKKGTFSNNYSDLNSASDAPPVVQVPSPTQPSDPYGGPCTGGYTTGSTTPWGPCNTGPVDEGSGTVDTGGGGSTGSGGTGTTGGGTSAGTSTCSPSVQNAGIGSLINWSIGNPTNGVYYLWTGSEVESASTYNTDLGYATGPNVSVSYTTSGQKSMNVSVISNTDDTVLKDINCGATFVSDFAQ